MKKLIVLIISFGFLNASCLKSKHFIDYFPVMQNDSIFNTEIFQNDYYSIYEKRQFPDSMALKYFFNNNITEMQAVDEGYNVDNHTYTSTSYIKEVCPFFKKKSNDLYLLCYGIESVFYLTIYDDKNDKFINTLTISNFSEDVGDEVTHSIIFPNNLIVTLEYRDKVYCKLTKIDFKNHKFIEIKKLTANEGIDFKEALPILGINENGELLKD